MANLAIRDSIDGLGGSDVESIQARLRNPNYMAKIVYQASEAGEPSNNPDFGVISLHLPDKFQFNFSSSFDQPFSQGLVNAPGFQQAAKFFGASLTSQSMSVQVWQGTTCPEFSLTFELVAMNDPVQDILSPIKKLSKLALPGVVAGLLTPPGPRIDPEKVASAAGALAAGGLKIAAGAIAGIVTQDYGQILGNAKSASKGVGTALDELLSSPVNNVTLHIGRFLVFPSVVLQSVSQTYDTIFDKQGLPLKASVDVTFSTWYVPVKTDVDKIFQGRG